MANDYIIKKWRLWFRALDINHRGQISPADVQQEGETFAELSHVDAEKRKDIIGNLHKIWNDVVFRGNKGPIKEEQFVEMNCQQYEADKTKFKEELLKAYTVLFTDVMDVLHEGFVTEEEFVNAMKSIGHANEALEKKFFSFFKPDGGKVPLQVLIDSWVQFTTSDDSSQEDVVKEALESGM